MKKKLDPIMQRFKKLLKIDDNIYFKSVKNLNLLKIDNGNNVYFFISVKVGFYYEKSFSNIKKPTVSF